MNLSISISSTRSLLLSIFHTMASTGIPSIRQRSLKEKSHLVSTKTRSGVSLCSAVGMHIWQQTELTFLLSRKLFRTIFLNFFFQACSKRSFGWFVFGQTLGLLKIRMSQYQEVLFGNPISPLKGVRTLKQVRDTLTCMFFRFLHFFRVTFLG